MQPMPPPGPAPGYVPPPPPAPPRRYGWRAFAGVGCGGLVVVLALLWAIGMVAGPPEPDCCAEPVAVEAVATPTASPAPTKPPAATPTTTPATPAPSSAPPAAPTPAEARGTIRADRRDVDPWPFRADAGVLQCRAGAVTFVAPGGAVYALNGVARTQPGVRPLDAGTPMWLDDETAMREITKATGKDSPRIKVPLTAAIAAGQKLC